MKETIERLRVLADRASKYNYPKESNMVVKISDIDAVLEFYEAHKSESELIQNVSEYTETELNCKGCFGPCGQCKDEPIQVVPDVTPEWDKIPEGFDWVAIDKNGEEYAYSEEPYRNGFDWVVNGIHGRVHITWRKFDMSVIDFVETLSQRPAK